MNKIIKKVAEKLKEAGIENPPLDARILLEYATGLTKEKILLGDFSLTEEQEQKFLSYIERRKNREPVSHIIGSREFWGLEFKVSGDVLDPRPDSETLIEAALEIFHDRRAPLKILDFGTGSGCLLLSLLHEFQGARGLGVDISGNALIVAAENSENLGLTGRVEFKQGSWGEGLSGNFDLIVSNPPYIKKNEIENLSPEVANYEPKLALDGGIDGLKCYRELMPHIKRLLDKNGRALIEIGQGQGKALQEIAANNNMKIITTKKDLAGIERCLVFTHR